VPTVGAAGAGEAVSKDAAVEVAAEFPLGYRRCSLPGAVIRMFSGAVHLFDNPNPQEDDSGLPGLVTNLNEVSRIVESEMNVAIQSLARARVQGNVSTSMAKPTMH